VLVRFDVGLNKMSRDNPDRMPHRLQPPRQPLRAQAGSIPTSAGSARSKNASSVSRRNLTRWILPATSVPTTWENVLTQIDSIHRCVVKSARKLERTLKKNQSTRSCPRRAFQQRGWTRSTTAVWESAGLACISGAILPELRRRWREEAAD